MRTQQILTASRMRTARSEAHLSLLRSSTNINPTSPVPALQDTVKYLLGILW